MSPVHNVVTSVNGHNVVRNIKLPFWFARCVPDCPKSGLKRSAQESLVSEDFSTGGGVSGERDAEESSDVVVTFLQEKRMI